MEDYKQNIYFIKYIGIPFFNVFQLVLSYFTGYLSLQLYEAYFSTFSTFKPATIEN